MQRHLIADQPLDQIAALARSGDGAAETALFESLRVRFLDVAKRRVRTDDIEDVVQESLRIIHLKYRQTDPQTRVLTWAMVVLRNVIGNYYQKRKRLDRAEPFEDQIHSAAPDVQAADYESAPLIPDHDSIRPLLDAIRFLGEQYPRCGRLFRSILENIEKGEAPKGIPSDTIDQLLHDLGGISRDTLYVTLHRCRKRLREIMRDINETEGGVGPAEAG